MSLECRMEGCEYRVRVKSLALCGSHYAKLRKYGDPAIGKTFGKHKVCTLEWCDRPFRRNGYCDLHDQRAKRGADLTKPAQSKYRTPAQAFEALTEQAGDCLVWREHLNDQGYGVMRTPEGIVRAHRYAWEQQRGPIPEGAVLDHACHNRACVNVEHLRIASQMQNTWNRSGPQPNSLSGVRNVRRLPSGSYQVRVGRNGVAHYSPALPTLEAAKAVAESMRNELFGAFAGKG